MEDLRICDLGGFWGREEVGNPADRYTYLRRYVSLFSYVHCKNESVYCTLNCLNTHTKNKNSVCIGTKWCAVNTCFYSVAIMEDLRICDLGGFWGREEVGNPTDRYTYLRRYVSLFSCVSIDYNITGSRLLSVSSCNIECTRGISHMPAHTVAIRIINNVCA